MRPHGATSYAQYRLGPRQSLTSSVVGHVPPAGLRAAEPPSTGRAPTCTLTFLGCVRPASASSASPSRSTAEVLSLRTVRGPRAIVSTLSFSSVVGVSRQRVCARRAALDWSRTHVRPDLPESPWPPAHRAAHLQLATKVGPRREPGRAVTRPRDVGVPGPALDPSPVESDGGHPESEYPRSV